MSRKVAIKPITVILFSIFSLAVIAMSLNDPLFPDQWNLNDNGIRGEGQFNIGFEDFKNSGITEDKETITVIFSGGIKSDHEDLIGSLWSNPDEIPNNNIDDDSNGFVDDVHGINAATLSGDQTKDITGYGTAIASIIAAQQNNGLGIAGISSSTKIAHCRYINPANTLRYDEAISRCIDYVLDLKINKNKTIASVLVDTILEERYVYDVQLSRDPFERLHDNDILVVVPSNTAFHQDYYLSYPSSYLLNNVITAGALNTTGFMWNAPGENTLSTLAPGNILRVASYLDTFKSSGINITQFDQSNVPFENLSNVDIVQDPSTTDDQSWRLNIGTDDTIINFPQINLSAYADKTIGLTFDSLNPTNYGYVIEFFNNEVGLWENLNFGQDIGNSWHSEWFTIDLAETRFFESLANFQIRVLITGHPSRSGEAYIDNVELFDLETSLPRNNYFNLHGPKLAAAQVSGVIAVAKSTTNLSNWQIRNLLISSGVETNSIITTHDDYILDTSINNKILTLYGKNSDGVLNCLNQTAQRRLYPSAELTIPRVLSREMIIKGIKLNCESSDGNLEIQNQLTGETYLSVDDGVGLDELANDGFNITTINFDQIGSHTLKIDGDEDFTVLVGYPYQSPKQYNLIWTDTELANEFFGRLPFDFKFGGIQQGFSDLLTFNRSNASFDIVESRLFGSDDPSSSVNINTDSEINHKYNSQKYSKLAYMEFVEMFQTDPEPYDPSFVPNTISNPFLETVKLSPFQLAENTPYAFKLSKFMYGEEGDRTVIIELNDDNEYSSAPTYTAQAQIIFFEKNSTIIMSYSNFSEDIANDIQKRALRIGSNYELIIEDAYQNSVSYVFKEDDGVNSIPVFRTNSIQLRQDEVSVIDLNLLLSDPDKDTLIFSSDLDESFISIDRLGILKSTLTNEYQGGDQIKFNLTVSDGEESISSEIIIEILESEAVNNPPTLNIESLSLITSEDFSVDLTQFLFDEEDDDITITAESLPYNFTLANGLLTAKLFKSDHPLTIGELVFLLDDGFNIVESTVQIELSYLNHHPEQVSQFPDISLQEGESRILVLDEYFTDLDQDILEYSTNSSLASIIKQQSETQIEITGQNAGNYIIQLEINDLDGGVITSDINIQVTAQPVVVTPPPQSSSSGGGSSNPLILLLLVIISLVRMRDFPHINHEVLRRL